MKKLALLALCVLALSFFSACKPSNSGAGGNTVTMGGTTFGSDSVTINKGETIIFQDEQSGSPHILVIGKNGVAESDPGAPDFGANGHMFNAGDSWTTPPWDTPGTYHVSCTVHPSTMGDFVVTVKG
jgi:plastocyanin